MLCWNCGYILIFFLVPTVTSGANARLESASSLLDLADVASRGKHFVARDNVKTGNILLVEKPSVSALLHTQLGTHCLHCMKRLVVPYGCPECSGVAFCSLECRDTACATYHRFECKFMDLLIGSGMSVLCFLALRAVTQCASPAEAIEQGRKIIGDLCGHSNQRLPEDFLRRGVMAAFLMSILQRSGFFGQRKAGSSECNFSKFGQGNCLIIEECFYSQTNVRGVGSGRSTAGIIAGATVQCSRDLRDEIE